MSRPPHQDSPAPDGPLLLVLGMHRSGTSAVSRICNLLGMDLGGEVLTPQAGVNEAGFWEHQRVVALNESMLDALHKRWFDIGAFDWEAVDSGQRASLQARAETLLRSEFRGKGAVLIKDPRMCRLLSMWLPAATAVGLDCRIVLVLRHPLAVARSLAQRDGFDLDTGYCLWLRHVLEAELATRRLPRVFIDYDTLVSDPRAGARRIIDGLDLGAVTGDPSRLDLDGAVPQSLRHHLLPARSDGSTLALLAMSVYETIRSHELAMDLLLPFMEGAAARFEATTQQCADFVGALERTNRLLVAARVQLSEIGELHSAALATLSKRDARLTELEAERRGLGQELGHAMAVVQERDRQLEGVNGERDRLGNELGHALQVVAERDRQLTAAGKERERLGNELRAACAVVQERDAQLAAANAERESLGAQLGHAIAVVRERDGQLGQAAAERAQLEGRLRGVAEALARRDAQLDRLLHSWLGPLLRRLAKAEGQ